MFVLLRTLIIGMTILLTHCGLACAAESPKPNVLFIPVDDLNHWVGHLGRNPQTRTPNIDRLAKMGVTFTNAHCAAPVCNPSRAALLSGMRPGTTGIYDNGQPFGLAINAEQSVVTQFRNAGYETLGMGKLWHGGLGFPEQWTNTGGPEHAANHRADQLEDRSIGGIKFGVLDADDEAVPDTAIADYVIAELGKPHDKPFFLTAGFHKPHMPWNVPRKYFDMHPLDQIQLPPTKDGDLNDVPAAGIRMAKPEGDHRKVLESGRWKEAVQAYLAAISYLDGQVGRLLDALEKSPHRDNTIICLWGDHGWHLGEKEHWRKFALWEEATRAPLIWVVPDVTTAGSVCNRPVDFMTIYATLCDLTGVTVPAYVEGTSIRSLLSNPASTEPRVAITTYGRNNHAVRDDRWRYIRYADGGEELYDHTNDPYEWTNLAADPEHTEVKKQLAIHFPTNNVPTAGTARARNYDGDNGNRQKGKRQRQKNAGTRPVSLRRHEKHPTNMVFFVVDDLDQHDVFGGAPPRKVRLTQDHAVYAGMVEAMDQAVGKVVSKLDELELADNTLVIMTSDNGGLSTSKGSPTSNQPLRAGKGWLYEGGTRTSLIARWPGVISPGTVNTSRVISADYFPTILDAAGLPLLPEHHKDGVSHLASLKSGEPAAPRPLFWHYPHYGNQGGAPRAAVLDGDWKLIEWFDTGTVELFNLASDPNETKNLVEAEHAQVERLQRTLHDWQADVGAVKSEPNPNFDPLKPNGRG